jgi:hypothetical protein
MIAALLSGAYARLIAIGAAVLAVLGVVAAVFRAGRKSAEADNLQSTLDAMRKANEARRDVDSLSDAAVDDRMQRWTRHQ